MYEMEVDGSEGLDFECRCVLRYLIQKSFFAPPIVLAAPEVDRLFH